MIVVRAMPALERSPRRPPALSPEVSKRMRRTKTAGTGPEVALRRLLHQAGYRYRVQYRPAGLPRRTIDVAFPRVRLAVFIDGCFWHGCPDHGSVPKSNRDWWAHKLGHNKERDADTGRQLRILGWRVLRFWEHESPMKVFAVVRSAVEQLGAPAMPRDAWAGAPAPSAGEG